MFVIRRSKKMRSLHLVVTMALVAIATVVGYDAGDEQSAVISDQHDPSPLISPRQTGGCSSLTVSLSPCRCVDMGGPAVTVAITCKDTSLDNAGLKAVTEKLPLTLALRYFFLDDNQITSIAKGVLDKGWPSLLLLDLANNPNLATIEDGALPIVYATPSDASNKVEISLNGAISLTKFNEKTFKPVLDYFEGKNYGFIGLKISYDDAFLDCSATSCGSQAWIFTNPKYVQYFPNAYCSDRTPLTSLTFEKCFCPSVTPCFCAASTLYPGALDISCNGQSIGDANMETIISNIPATTQIGKLDLSGTGITQVPSGLTKFTTISELSLAENQITAVNNGALAVNSSILMKLDLSGNAKLATIGNSSLPLAFAAPSSSAGNTTLDVSNCNLTQLNQAAFEPILKYFVDNNFTATGSNSASIIIGSNPLDCSSSTCGSESWLILSSDKYKSFVSTANGAPTCGDKDRTAFLSLNPVICIKCPFEDVFPCTCSVTKGEVASPPETISIDCSGAMLGDKGVEMVLNKVPATNAMVGIVLSGNDLTYVPKRLAQFENLVLVVLSKNNISAVKQGDLALASPQANTIDLSNNQIKTIENGPNLTYCRPVRFLNI